MELPSRFQIGDLISFRFTEDAPKIPARVHAIHFTVGKVKYDVIVHIGGDDYTRVYNLDSYFVDEA